MTLVPEPYAHNTRKLLTYCKMSTCCASSVMRSCCYVASPLCMPNFTSKSICWCAAYTPASNISCSLSHHSGVVQSTNNYRLAVLYLHYCIAPGLGTCPLVRYRRAFLVFPSTAAYAYRFEVQLADKGVPAVTGKNIGWTSWTYGGNGSSNTADPQCVIIIFTTKGNQWSDQLVKVGRHYGGDVTL